MQDVPSGTRVRSSDKGAAELVYPNGSFQILQPCAEAIPESSHRPGSWRSAVLGDQNGYHSRPVTWWGPKLSQPLDYFSTEYYVPPEPQTGPGLSWWIGVEDDPVTVVIQPVVWTTRTGGDAWWVVSEICCPGDHDIRSGDREIQSRDAIYGSIERDYGTHYTISINDESGTEYRLHHDMGTDMVLPLIEAEMYEASYTCSDLPTDSLQAQELRSDPAISFRGAVGSLMRKCGWNAWIGEDQSGGVTASADPPGQVAPQGEAADVGRVVRRVAAAPPPGLVPPQAVVV